MGINIETEKITTKYQAKNYINGFYTAGKEEYDIAINCVD